MTTPKKNPEHRSILEPFRQYYILPVYIYGTYFVGEGKGDAADGNQVDQREIPNGKWEMEVGYSFQL